MDRVKRARERLTNTIAEAARQSEERARGSQPQGVHFDPNDGHKRVLIEIDGEGKYLPIAYWGMHSGLAEANIVVTHMGLILAEMVAGPVYAHEVASLGPRDGE